MGAAQKLFWRAFAFLGQRGRNSQWTRALAPLVKRAVLDVLISTNVIPPGLVFCRFIGAWAIARTRFWAVRPMLDVTSVTEAALNQKKRRRLGADRLQPGERPTGVAAEPH